MSQDKTKALVEFETHLSGIAMAATDDEKNAVRKVTDPGTPMGFQTFTPAMAAILFLDHNKDRNRDFSIAKAQFYAAEMDAGNWKKNHMGVAFYADSMIADGQHRMAAIALHGKPVSLPSMANFDDDAFDTIDVGKGRNAGDALKLRGVELGGVKSSIAKSVMAYESKMTTGTSPALSVIAVEKFVQAHDEQISAVLNTVNQIDRKVADAVLSQAEAATLMLLMVRGGYTASRATSFLTDVQVGVANTEGEPAMVLNGIFRKAKTAKMKSHLISKEMKIILGLKGAAIAASGRVCNNITFKKGKEPLPATHPPAPEMANA